MRAPAIDWWPTERHFEMLWGSQVVSSLAEARTVAGIETLGGTPVGQNVAPEVCAVGQGPTMYPQPQGR